MVEASQQLIMVSDTSLSSETLSSADLSTMTGDGTIGSPISNGKSNTSTSGSSQQHPPPPMQVDPESSQQLALSVKTADVEPCYQHPLPLMQFNPESLQISSSVDWDRSPFTNSAAQHKSPSQPNTSSIDTNGKHLSIHYTTLLL
jgi:hypothetical protein